MEGFNFEARKNPLRGFSPGRAREICSVGLKSIFLSLLREPLGGGFVNAISSFVFLAKLLDQAAGHEVLKLLIGPEAKHFFATANGVANFQILEDAFEQVVETEDLVFRKDDAKFIGNMIGKSA